MLTTVTTTNRNRVAWAHTLLLNTNRITDFFEGGTYATGTITITSIANLLAVTPDTITVAGVAFTAQDGEATPGEATFRAKTSLAATATSLAVQLNAYDETGTALDLSRVTAAASGANVTLTADNYGTAANAYTLEYSDEGTDTIGATVSAATLLGGLASTSTVWYNERKNDRRDKADEYKLSTTYPVLKKAVDSSDIQNVRIQLTTTERNEEAFVKTLNVNIDDIIKVVYYDADESLVYLARGAFKIDKYRVTHTRAEVLALQNAVYKRGIAGTDCTVTEYGDGDFHKSVIVLSDLSITVATGAEGDGSTFYTLAKGHASVSHCRADVKISSTNHTDTPEMGVGHVKATGGIATLTEATYKSIIDAAAIGAITSLGTTVTVGGNAGATYYPAQAVALYDGSGTAMPLWLNFADTWTGDGDVVINGTITVWWRLRGE